MSEPEELILEGAHFATRLARETWQRLAPPPRASGVALQSVRTRLELFISALFGVPIPVAQLEPPAPPTWLSKLAAGSLRARPSVLCGNDGHRVLLAPALNVEGNNEAALALFRLLAVEQAARVTRQSQQTFVALTTARARDLFLVAEAASVDRWIAREAPGLLPVLRDTRARALARRIHAAAPVSDLERIIREMLAADPAAPLLDLPSEASAEQCAEWAERRAAGPGGKSRANSNHAIMCPLYWGELLEPSALRSASARPGSDPEPAGARRPRVSEMRRRPRVREAADDEDDDGAGSWVIRADDPQESVEDPFGLQRPADRDDHADPEGLGDSLSDLPEARVVRTPDKPREVLRSGDPIEVPDRDAIPAVAPAAGIAYPEWDYRVGAYRLPGAVVRQRAAQAGDPAWVTSTLSRHARLVHRVRARFQRLRPRPVRVFRQVDGADVDVAAYVTAAADRRARVAGDGRLYVATRAARRELAVALLLDVSASTDAWVSTNRRIVDVEKDAVLVVCEALDALGDRYGVFAFSGEGASHVELVPLKSFDEPSGLMTRRRIAALDSERYTRLGAAMRHVTAVLCREQAASRLLLLLSDGKPNDIDVYEGRYGIEDTRQAAAEARRQGVTVFCVTVDREAPRYAGRIFGSTGFTLLHKPEQLPNVIVEVLRILIRV